MSISQIISQFQEISFSEHLDSNQILESIKKIFSLIPLDQFEHEIIWAICINYELIPIIKSYLCKINLILTKLPFIDSLLIYNLFKEGIISKEQILHAKIAFKFEESLNNDNKSSIHEEK